MPLKVHFLNVGHGDCTVIEHASGRISVIDINNGSDLDSTSLSEIAALYGVQSFFLPPTQLLLESKGYSIKTTNPIEYLTRGFSGRSIMRYIQSHPDMDHLRGISSLIKAGFLPTNFWDTTHNKEPEIQNRDAEDWETYLSLRNGHNPKVTVIRPKRGSFAQFYNRGEDQNPGGDGIEILSPDPKLQQWANENEEWNELSLVLKITYAGKTMILGGDAGEPAWEAMYEYYGEQLKCDVLKASHHGRDSGYYQPAVKAMSPAVTIVSVGKKPDQDASSLYRCYCDNVWSTRWKGNITLTFQDDPNKPILYDWEYER